MQAVKVSYTLLLTGSPSIDVWIRSNGPHINHSQDSVYKEYVESVAKSTESGTSSDGIQAEPPCFCNKPRFRCFQPDIKETKFDKSFNHISTSQIRHDAVVYRPCQELSPTLLVYTFSLLVQGGTGESIPRSNLPLLRIQVPRHS